MAVVSITFRLHEAEELQDEQDRGGSWMKEDAEERVGWVVCCGAP